MSELIKSVFDYTNKMLPLITPVVIPIFKYSFFTYYVLAFKEMVIYLYYQNTPEEKERQKKNDEYLELGFDEIWERNHRKKIEELHDKILECEKLGLNNIYTSEEKENCFKEYTRLLEIEQFNEILLKREVK